MLTCQGYSVADPDGLETPAMLLFQDRMYHNLRSVCEVASGGQNLMVHVKTHKSEAVTREQVEAGFAGFKCATLRELAMVLRAGARKAILSYPQLQERKIERLFDLTSAHPDAWIATIVSTRPHLEILGTVAARRFLQPSGFHLYDGHDEFTDVAQREAAVFRLPTTRGPRACTVPRGPSPQTWDARRSAPIFPWKKEPI